MKNLFVTTALSSMVLWSSAAGAAENGTTRPVSTPAGSPARSPARPPVAAAKEPAPAMEAMVVLGAGAARQVQTLSRSELQKTAPGTSPFKTLSKLPGVMFSASDPMGAYEWSQQIIIRGFTQNQLGFTMDGVPLGDLNYGNDNGLSINRALQTENNGPATIAQGAGALGTAASNNLGGTLTFSSIDPTRRFGVDVSGTVGSAGTYRTFMRVNSGELAGGGRFYVGYDWSDANKWKGSGIQRQQQANAKYIQPVGEHVKVTLFADWSELRQNDYQDLSPSMIRQFGYDVDNITGNYALAQQVARAYQAGRPLPSGYTDPNDVYWNSDGKRNDVLSYGRVDADLAHGLTGFATVYGHLDQGQGLFATPFVPTPAALGGGAISARNTNYDIHREGLLTGLTYHVGHHTIEGGFWFENNIFEESRAFYPLDATSGPAVMHWYTNPFVVQWGYVFGTRTYQTHLQDTWQITKALKGYAGFKSLIVDNSSRSVYPQTGVGSQFAAGTIGAANAFLPQVGLNDRLDAHNEVFVDYSRNMNAFTSAATAGPFSTSQAGFDAIRGKLKPEMSNTEELGWRFHNRIVQASLTGYYVEFENRLLATQTSSAIVGTPTALANVGGVTARGVEAAATWRLARNWSLYGSYAFNNSFYDSNVYSGSGQLEIATKGRDVVATPRNMANVQLSYDDGAWWGNILMQYQGKRYYTYTNDQHVAPNAIFNLAVGYRFQQPHGVLHGVDMQLNVTNLFNKQYVATVGSTGFVATDPGGTYQTLQAGAPQMVFFTLSKHFD
ncbi:TonB-dependent receptor [Gluconacetobacter tumulisoli]|uniref:TonB-dependent receptor n=2 Tax=Gluconacetobacter tumulisoli TaxID=1286189 RepID=A0A7W4K562_9PROT|nr:TonB-dependent receptor [Gluconacetobacter tumulisoli]